MGDAKLINFPREKILIRRIEVLIQAYNNHLQGKSPEKEAEREKDRNEKADLAALKKRKQTSISDLMKKPKDEKDKERDSSKSGGDAKSGDVKKRPPEVDVIQDSDEEFQRKDKSSSASATTGLPPKKSKTELELKPIVKKEGSGEKASSSKEGGDKPPKSKEAKEKKAVKKPPAAGA